MNVRCSLTDVDPFVGVNEQGTVYAQTPCWSLLRMPTPTCIEKSHRHAIALLAIGMAHVTLNGRALMPYEAAVYHMLKHAAAYLCVEYTGVA